MLPFNRVVLLSCVIIVLLLPSPAAADDYTPRFSSPSSPLGDNIVLQQHEAHLDSLFRQGEAKAIVEYATQLLSSVPDVERNTSQYGGVYKYLGAAFHTLGDLLHATQAFALATSTNTEDVENWMLLSDTLLHQMRASEAAAVLEEALVNRHLSNNWSKLFKARSWTSNWKDYGALQDNIRHFIAANLQAGRSPGVGAAEYSNVDPFTLLQICRSQPNAQPPPPSAAAAAAAKDGRRREDLLPAPDHRHRIGFVTSDLGVHPVSSLIRGFLTMLNASHFEVHVYCLKLVDSFWRRNITSEVDFFHSLHGLSTVEAAAVIQQHRIHTLIDLNGHTMHSGLPILALRSAPIQMSFLGSPMTTGADFVDYIVTDPLTSPPWTWPSYSEKLLLLPPSYMVNDHAQLMDHVLHRPRRRKEQQEINDADEAFSFACFSNFIKMDPEVFGVWTNILRRAPSSHLSMMQYQLYQEANSNLKSEAAARGIQTNRLHFRPQKPWIDHVWAKTDVDLALDTFTKNGHTTSIDALWAGVPLVTLPGERMEQRAGMSLYGGLGEEELEAMMVMHSVKEYEDFAVDLAMKRGDRSANPLGHLRSKLEGLRTSSRLFKTDEWTSVAERAFDAAFEVQAVVGAAWHLWIHGELAGVTPTGQPPASFAVDSLAATATEIMQDRKQEKKHSKTESSDSSSSSSPVTLLHIGGLEPKRDWTIVNVKKGPYVDVVASMDNLTTIASSSVTAIYASHVLEHASHGYGKGVEKTLAEWHRVLKAGAVAFISVPNLRVLSSLFINETLSLSERAHVMRMMYGGQSDEHDFHLVGFDQDLLMVYLAKTGFCQVQRIGEGGIGLFHDSSNLIYLGQEISLNVMATACKDSSEPWISVKIGSLGQRKGEGGKKEKYVHNER